MIACYLDESSDRKRERVFSVAGFLQRNSYWLDFESRWKDLLDQLALQYFKASECINLSGEFAKFRTGTGPLTESEVAKANAIRADFIDVIITSKLEGVGVSILLRDFWELLRGDPRCAHALGQDPFFVAYQAVMFETVRRSSAVFPDDFVAFVCDSHDQSGVAENVYTSLREKNPVTGRRMGSLSYEDDKAYLPLQAADLLASEVRLKTGAWLNGTPEFPGFARLRDSGALAFIAYWDKQYMLSVLDANP